MHSFTYLLSLGLNNKKSKKRLKNSNDQLGTERKNMGGRGMLQNPSALKKKGSACTTEN
jgi:hypothetical protein